MTFTVDATNLFLTTIKAEADLKDLKVSDKTPIITKAFSTAGLLTAIDSLKLRDEYEEYKKNLEK